MLKQRGCSDRWWLPSPYFWEKRKLRPRAVSGLLTGTQLAPGAIRFSNSGLGPSEQHLMSALGCTSGMQPFSFACTPANRCRVHFKELQDKFILPEATAGMCAVASVTEHTLGLWWLACGFYCQWGSWTNKGVHWKSIPTFLFISHFSHEYYMVRRLDGSSQESIIYVNEDAF